MGATSTGTRGESQFASAGNPPTFAADLSLVATEARKAGIRPFTTQALMNSSTGSASGEYASVAAIPGVLFQLISAVWTMIGVPQFATASARDAAITAPTQGMLARCVDSGITWQYYAIYNSSTNAGGAIAAGWYPAIGGQPYIAARRAASQAFTASTWVLANAIWSTPTDLFGFTYSAGVFTATIAGWYWGDVYCKGSAAATPIGLQLVLNSTAQDTNASVIQMVTSGAASAQHVGASGKVKLAVGDTLALYAYNPGTPVFANDFRFDLDYRGPARF